MKFVFDPDYVAFDGIDAGTYGPDVHIYIEEDELIHLTSYQLRELEWILQHPKTGQEAVAYSETGYRNRTLITVRSLTPCITTLPERKPDVEHYSSRG